MVMAGDDDRITCSKCGKSKVARKDFFKLKNGERCDMCKSCLTQFIDNYDPQTFLWILEMFDVPFVKKIWIEQRNKIAKKKGGEHMLGPGSVIGQYIRTMNMKQYESYCYADSDKLNFASQKAESERDVAASQQREAELLRRLDEGEISKAQYDTMSETTIDDYDVTKRSPQAPNKPITNELVNDLSSEDLQYLNLKWGYMYSVEQWIIMETMYQKYLNEYEINVDREEVLKKMCKTSLKMDECLDAGDLGGYKNLAAVFDQLRKSGKFTEQQNKEEKKRQLDSIGELVKLCELKGGPIRPELDPYDYPQDKIDFTIKDIQSYVYNLVTKEHGLGNLIESYIEKLERKEEMEAAGELSLGDDFITSREEEEAQVVTDEEAAEYQTYMMQLREEDAVRAEAEELAEHFGVD